MKTEDIISINKELRKEIQKNNEKINISDERKRMSNVNQLEYKALETIAFSLLPYLGFLILCGSLTKNGIMLALTKNIPAEIFTYILMGSSLSMGIIGRKILEWKFKTKERLKKFTTANTQSEKIQEEIKYTIELEKAKNRNKAILQTIDSLSLNHLILNLLSSRCNSGGKENLIAEEENKRRFEDLSTLLKDKYAELDILTIKKVLHEKFWRVRTKGQKIMDTIVAGIISGIITMMLVSMPIIILRDYISSGWLLPLVTPFIVGVTAVSGYMIKTNREYTNIFNNYNNELGKDSLPQKINNAYEEQRDIDAKIEGKIREISIVITQLQEQKISMSSSLNSTDKLKRVENQTIPEEHTIEEGFPVQTKESSLVLRRKIDNHSNFN